MGFDHPGIVDDGIDHLARRDRRQLNRAAVDLDRPGIADERFERLASRDVLHLARDGIADAERDETVAVEIERESVARRQCDFAERRGDRSGIAYAWRNQGGEATGLRGDGPLVDDRSVRAAGLRKLVFAGHEVGVGDVVSRREEAACLNLSGRANENPVGIDEEDLTVAGQRSVQGRRPQSSCHPIEDDRTRAGLHEAHGLAYADVEGLPIDDGVRARLRDRDVGRPLSGDRDRAADDLSTERIGVSDLSAERNERGRREQERCGGDGTCCPLVVGRDNEEEPPGVIRAVAALGDLQIEIQSIERCETNPSADRRRLDMSECSKSGVAGEQIAVVGEAVELGFRQLRKGLWAGRSATPRAPGRSCRRGTAKGRRRGRNIARHSRIARARAAA